MAQSINSTVEFTMMLMSKITFKSHGQVLKKLVPTSPEIKSADILKSLPTKENFSLPQKILAKF